MFNRRPHSRLFFLQADARRALSDRRAQSIDDFGAPGTVQGTPSMVSHVTAARLRTVATAAMVVLALFVGRAAQLQIVQGSGYQALAAENRRQTQLILPLRGTIQDRNGERLAWNEPAFILTMTAARLPKDESQRNALFAQVAQMVGMNPIDIELIHAQAINRPFDSVPVADGLAYDAAMRIAIAVARLHGFDLEVKSRRTYLQTIPSLSHVLGYTGAVSADDLAQDTTSSYRLIDDIGKTGVERTYETTLRGTPGKLVYEVNARGQRLSILSKQDPVPGQDLALTIDATFQAFATERLVAHAQAVNALRGSVVAMDPRSGEVRALVSWPTFDNNEFTGGIDQAVYARWLTDPNQPLFNRAIAGEFPSGSIFKPYVAYAGLAEGIVGEYTSFVSTGGVRIGQWFFPDWKAGGHGVTDVRKAIAESVNTYFYILGGGLDQVTGLGVERISDYARRFGFGAPTEIDIPGEGDGFLPSKEWKEQTKGERWYVGDTYHYAIGQGDFLTTPLQMAVALSTIANGGYRIKPHVVFGDVSSTPLEGLNLDALRIVREGMRRTVTQGSARSLMNLRKAVAGKTGTAQTPGDRPYHSWFTGFGPYEDPNLVLVVLIEEGGESNDAAVPLARELFDWWFLYGE